MPASDYTSTVSGGLKLKGGAKDAGVKKKSKKSKTSKDKTSKPQEATTAAAAAEPESTKPSDTTLALLNPPSDHDRDVTPSASTGGTGTGTGKTEAQRRHEEIKRKRVSLHTNTKICGAKPSSTLYTNSDSLQLDDRLKREGGAKTHKQRVEELNKYLSTLSEHHDMPRIGPG
jgi:protein FAM32A